MATRTIGLQAFSSSTGAPLSGLSLNFSGAGYYRINGLAASAPSIVDAGDGSYSFAVSLSEGERAEWRIDCGATARSRYAFGTVYYADLVQPADASAWTPTRAGYLDAAVSSRASAADVPSASTIATTVDAVLSYAHGAGAWSTAGGGSQEVVISVVDDSSQALPGARVEALLGTLVVARVWTDVTGAATLYLDPAEYAVRASLTGYTAAGIDATVSVPDTISPAVVTLAAAAAPEASPEAPIGLTRTLVYGEVLAGQEIARIVSGDSVNVTRTLVGVGSGDTVSAWLTVKPARRARERDDSDATVLQAIGVVSGTGSSRTLLFSLSPAQTLQLDGPLAYDVQVKVGTVIQTPEVGVIDALRGITTRTA
jgi:hypothetical protein